MSLSYAEGFRTQPESPFTDGQNLFYFDRETSWRVDAEEDGYRFTCTDPEDYEYFSSHRDEVSGLLKLCPVTSEIFDAGKTPEGYATFRVPTLERANEFAAEKLAGLPVAGIRAFQEPDMGNTTAPGYLHDITDGPEFHLPVSMGHDRHFHDLVGHFLGAATIDAKSFSVFRDISKDATDLWAKGPQWPPILYVYGVANGFDKFSDHQLRKTMKSELSREGYLLSQTLQWFQLNRSEYFSRAVEIVRSHGMDGQKEHGLYPVLVPWEMDTLPAHYDSIAARLK
jgi:hypothetical protein